MKKTICVIIVSLFIPLAFAQTEGFERPEYQEIKKRLISGWSTWNTRSVTSHVLLPEGFAINLAFRQIYWLEGKYLSEPLIGRKEKGAPSIRPGEHSWDGSYTQLEIKWEELHARVESAHDGEDLVILVTPLNEPYMPVKMVVESAMLWNKPGLLSRNGDSLHAKLPKRTIEVYTTDSHTDEFYINVRTPYLHLSLDEPVGISTGKKRSLQEIKDIVARQKKSLHEHANEYGELAKAYLAVQAGIAWNLIYEPKFDRVVCTVGRLWNENYGGYCLFGWDNFFMAYVTALDSRDLAYANIIEHLRGKTEAGFIPNDNRGNGSKSWDRSQPHVGGIMVWEIYRKYPERWFLEATFDDLLGWNRWRIKNRMNEGLLSYGSHEAKNPFKEPSTQTKITAGYESGMDDSPMYIGVPYNPVKNTLELQDVGLNCLFIADCKALAEMAKILDRTEEEKELRERAAMLSERMESLWVEDANFYLNKRTDTGEFSHRLSPTMFYPMLAGLPSVERAKKMIDAHYYNPEEFAGEWILPSIARNDVDYPKQRYWKGAIWPPLNFLTYLSFSNYRLKKEMAHLSEKSLELFLKEYRRMGYVSENYSAITGSGDDKRLSSDRFHSWGALMGIIAFMEEGYLPVPGDDKSFELK